jgi:hypothetical protein
MSATIESRQQEEFPKNGYRMEDLSDVFKRHGPVNGWLELDRRSSYPPSQKLFYSIGVEAMQDAGLLIAPAQSEIEVQSKLLN